MSTQIDWREELDSSFGRAPDLPAAQYVVAGRRAVRRRRIAAAAVAATFAVIGGAACATSLGAAPRGDAPIATHGPAPTEGTDRRADRETERKTQLRDLARARERVDFLGNPAALTQEEMVLAPRTGAVLQRVRNPMGYTGKQGWSLAIRAMYEGREQYSLMAYFSDGGTSTSTVDATGDFAGWLEAAVGSQRFLDDANGVNAPSDRSNPDQWLQLGPEGEVEAAGPNVVLVEVRVDVDLGEDFARGTDRTGVTRLSSRCPSSSARSSCSGTGWGSRCARPRPSSGSPRGR